MYRVFKPAGFGTTITIINIDTHASVNIGSTTIKIMNILRSTGIAEGVIDPTIEWNFGIDEPTAKELVHLALNIKKPIRDQRKKPEDKPTAGKVGVDIDAFDLIYGI
jgi:hypothetical protein